MYKSQNSICQRSRKTMTCWEKFVWYDKGLTLKSVYKSIKKIKIPMGKKDRRPGQALYEGTNTNSQWKSKSSNSFIIKNEK